MRASILLAMLGAACASTGANSNSVTLMSNVDYRAPPLTVTVGQGGGHVRSQSSGDLDAVIDGNCLRGEMAGEPLQLCETEITGDGSQKWEGTSGQVLIHPQQDGTIKVDGYLTLRALRSYDVTQTLRPKQGGAWDDLRAQPVLFVIANTAADLHALRHKRRI